MLYAVRFYDRPEQLEIRKKYMEAHLAWLETFSSKVLAAGSLREKDNCNPDGALWIVNAESENEVREILTDDPFWKNGLRQRVEIRTWRKAFDKPVII